MASEILLTNLRSGDSNNNIFKTYYQAHPDKAEGFAQCLCNQPHTCESDIAGIIYNGDISADNFRKLVSGLTVYDEFVKRTGIEFSRNVNDYYFALVVNKMVADGQAPKETKITSDAQLTDLHKVLGKNLNYSDYVVGGDHSKNKIKYIKCKVPMKFLNSDIELKVPVKKNFFGTTFRLATEKVPATMTFIEDPDEKEYIVPAALWQAWTKELVSKRPTPNFLFAESKFLQFYIKPEPKNFRETLSANGMKKGLDIINAYKYEINNYNELVLFCDAESMAELKEDAEDKGYKWEPHMNGQNILKSNSGKFYVVDTSGDAITVFAST